MTGSSDTKRLSERTRLVIGGRKPAEQFGFVNTPIYRGSTVLYPTYEELKARRQKFVYGTKGTPTILALEEAWADISGAAGTVLVPSGLAAIVVALQSCLKAGDHMLVTDSVYRPTRQYADGLLKRFGVETTYYDPLVGAGIADLMRPNTTVVFTEAPGSQSFEMQDIPAIVAAAHARDILVAMDNTWATPLFFDAHAFGVDLSVQAGTKYYAAHSDVLIGTVSARTPELYKKLRAAWNQLGLIIAPEDAFLTLRGMRTMAIRLKEQMPAGIAVAEWLQGRPEVARVLHPALPGAPGHEIWKRDFTGASSLFTFELKPVSMKAVGAMLDGLALFGIGASWGGYESLVLPFDCKDYRTATKPDFKGPTIRIHIGLEDIEDLKADLDAGFARLRAVG